MELRTINYIHSMARKFLLCFHDFSVWNYQKCVPVLHSLAELTGRPFSVLVIPSTEGADADAVVGFREALVELRAEGFELALHGYKHKAEFSQGRSYMGLIGMNLTRGEAEFAGLSEFESTRLLQAGLAAWNELLGVDAKAEGGAIAPVAFIPPTWYSNKYLPHQVHALKMLYEDRFSLTTAKGRRYASAVSSFAGIPRFAEKLAFSFGRFVLSLPVGLPRIALHPVDFPRLTGEVRDLVRIALNNNRKLVHYSEL